MTTFLTVIFIKQATDESRFSDRSTLNQSKHDRSVQKLQRRQYEFSVIRELQRITSFQIRWLKYYRFTEKLSIFIYVSSCFFYPLNSQSLSLKSFFSFSFDKPLISCFPSSWLDKTCIIVYCFTTQRSSQINNR